VVEDEGVFKVGYIRDDGKKGKDVCKYVVSNDAGYDSEPAKVTIKQIQQG
jgi:hypothetical protein